MQESNKPISIVLDGPAGVGKSTIAKRLAQSLNYRYIDTGAMYRTATLLALENKLPLDHTGELQIICLVRREPFRFYFDNIGNLQIWFGARDVTELIRTPAVTERVSIVAALPKVRACLTDIQRGLAETNNTIMEGRDIGTVVLPHASHKFFLTASSETRAKRRYREVAAKNPQVSLASITDNIKNRDHLDSTREHAPMAMAADAILVDTSTLTIDEVIALILKHICK